MNNGVSQTLIGYQEDQLGIIRTRYELSISGTGYNIEDIRIARDENNPYNFEYYKVITFDDYPTKVNFKQGMFIEEVIHMCNTSKITDMSNMFFYCNSLTTINGTSKWNTENVTNMASMFLSCGNNNKNFRMDVSSFNTSKVTNMQNMFRSVATNTKSFSLDVSNFDTSNVTNMSAMFYYLAYYDADFTLELGIFDTSKATNMISTFQAVGKSSSKMNFSVTISNPNVTSYTNIFTDAATVAGSSIVVYYTSETSSLVDKMIATKSTKSNVFKDCIATDTTNLNVGDVLTIAGDNFNVIDVDDDTVTLLAQYGVGNDFRQISSGANFTFADTKEWTIVDGNKEIDIQTYSTNPKRLVNGYVDFLKSVTGANDIHGDLIALTQLKELGCSINDDYVTSSDLTCANSLHSSWLVNGQYWWTKSMFPSNLSRVWLVYNDGTLNPIGYTDSRGVRPVITVPKYIFNSDTITFTIDGVSYSAKSGMTWEQWVNNSRFNNGMVTFEESNRMVVSYPGPMVIEKNGVAVSLDDVISSGYSYSTRMYI